jgi:hypothetical protein
MPSGVLYTSSDAGRVEPADTPMSFVVLVVTVWLLFGLAVLLLLVAQGRREKTEYGTG